MVKFGPYLDNQKPSLATFRDIAYDGRRNRQCIVKFGPYLDNQKPSLATFRNIAYDGRRHGQLCIDINWHLLAQPETQLGN